MIKWQLTQVHVCSTHHYFPTIHMRGSTASSQSLLRRKRFSVVSRITNKCLLESVTVTQLLKQFPNNVLYNISKVLQVVSGGPTLSL